MRWITRPDEIRYWILVVGLVCLSGISACQATWSKTGPTVLVPSSTTSRLEVVSASPSPAVVRLKELIPSQEAATPTIRSITPTVTDFAICTPLEKHELGDLPGIVSDPYHPPPMGKDDRHQGVDFSYYRRGDRLSIAGVVVQSVLAGKVAAAISESFPFGNLVIIETPNEILPVEVKEKFGIKPDESLYLLYAHLQDPPPVRLGAQIQACQPIGAVGKSGNAGVAHLHLETRIGPAGVQFPEMGYYRAEATADQKRYYTLWRTSGIFRHFDPMALLSLTEVER
jgi:murein DD-endopeptidase MepM/ murein hydrolase activator NlpD